MAFEDDTRPGSGPDERFRVEPARLREVAARFEELADDASKATTYADTWVDFDPSGGAVIERFVDVTTGMDTGVRDLFADVLAAVAGSGAAIRASADRYEQLDADAAQRLDAGYWGH